MFMGSEILAASGLALGGAADFGGASAFALAAAAFFARLASLFFNSPLDTISPVSSSNWSLAVAATIVSAMLAVAVKRSDTGSFSFLLESSGELLSSQ